MGGRTHWFNLGRKDWGYSSVGRASQTRYPTFVPCFVPYFVLFSTQNQAQSESVLENTKRTKPLDLLGLMRFWDGGGKGSRTPDLLNAIETLYQLSYTPKNKTRQIIPKCSLMCKG